MKITVLDFAIVALPLVIVLATLLSRVRASLRRQAEVVSDAKKALLQAHIEALQAKANRNLTPLRRLGQAYDRPASLLMQAR